MPRGLARFAFLILIVGGLPLQTLADTIVVPLHFTTIQAAVDAAPAGGKIRVLAGVYSEQLTISKDVTIAGTGTNETFVGAPPTKDLKSFREDARGNRLAAIVRIASKARVRISGLTIRGPLPGICAEAKTIAIGISVEEGAQLDLRRARVTRISDEPVGDCLMFSIIVGFPGEAVGHVRLRKTLVERSQGPAIVVTGPFGGKAVSTGDVRDNVVTGLGRPGNFDQNGITILGGAIASVIGNTVKNNLCFRPDLGCGIDPIRDIQAYGIGVFEATAPGTVISRNTIEHNDTGIYLAEIDDCCVVSRNVAANNRFFGVVVQDGRNTISHNTIKNGRIGIAIVAGANDAEGVLIGNTIRRAEAKSIQRRSCCGFEARIVVEGSPFVADSGSAEWDVSRDPTTLRDSGETRRQPWYWRYR
jgi:parallel beta-helix repeat protein